MKTNYSSYSIGGRVTTDMNTIRSTWIGWGVLTVAGGGSYYFAKRSINADKRLRFEQDQKRRQVAEQMEEQERAARSIQPSSRQGHHKGSEHIGSPSGEASHDPAPTSHSTERDSSTPQSKYAPAEPYRSRKGDRFS